MILFPFFTFWFMLIQNLEHWERVRRVAEHFGRYSQIHLRTFYLLFTHLYHIFLIYFYFVSFILSGT